MSYEEQYFISPWTLYVRYLLTSICLYILVRRFQRIAPLCLVYSLYCIGEGATWLSHRVLIGAEGGISDLLNFYIKIFPYSFPLGTTISIIAYSNVTRQLQWLCVYMVGVVNIIGIISLEFYIQAYLVRNDLIWSGAILWVVCAYTGPTVVAIMQKKYGDYKYAVQRTVAAIMFLYGWALFYKYLVCCYVPVGRQAIGGVVFVSFAVWPCIIGEIIRRNCAYPGG